MSEAFGNFDLYEELEIIKTSTHEEIKKSYRKLAMVFIFIPDFNKINKIRNGIQIKIKEIQNVQKNSKEFHTLIQVK